MGRILVTGGTGFIGSHVVDCLVRDDHPVRIFSRKPEVPERLAGKDIEIFRGDLQDSDAVIEAMKGVDVFYHIGELKNNNKAAAEKNVSLVEKVIENLGEKGVGRFVFVSSITVSGIPSSLPADENTEPAVVLKDHYTSYKRRCEELISEKVRGEWSIVRPAIVYGPGSRYLGRLINAVEKFGPAGFPFIGHAENNVPLIFVKDLARAIYLSGLKPAASGQTFIITDGLRHTWFSFLDSIAGLLGKKLRILPFPRLLLKFPAIPFDLFSGILGVELDLTAYLDYFSQDLYFDNSKAVKLLEWKPEYALADGVKEMVEYYRVNHDR